MKESLNLFANLAGKALLAYFIYAIVAFATSLLISFFNPYLTLLGFLIALKLGVLALLMALFWLLIFKRKWLALGFALSVIVNVLIVNFPWVAASSSCLEKKHDTSIIRQYFCGVGLESNFNWGLIIAAVICSIFLLGLFYNAAMTNFKVSAPPVN
ncbi:MAG: hypothetical protein HWE16_18525 [Gammaproteobacteria bacterium]|nr:hypothetical protein [Gammaproteobacteria bacterium]